MTFIRSIAFAALLAATPIAASATTITFDNLPTTGSFGGNGNPFTLYTESGYTVSAPDGQYVQSVDGLGKGLLTGAFNTMQSATLTIVGPASFVFNSFQALSNGASSEFSVTGFQGIDTVYSYSGSVPANGINTFSTFANLFIESVDRVVISTSATNQLRVDNIGVEETSAVPEPASWAMMVGGFGLLGGALRRRHSGTVSPVAFH